MNDRQIDTAYIVTVRTADRPRNGRPSSQQATRTAISASHCDVTWICHQPSHCTSSTTTAWYQDISTIQDDIDEATSTSFTLGDVYSFLVRAGSSYSELMTQLGYTDMQEREQLCAIQETTVWW